MNINVLLNLAGLLLSETVLIPIGLASNILIQLFTAIQKGDLKLGHDENSQHDAGNEAVIYLNSLMEVLKKPLEGHKPGVIYHSIARPNLSHRTLKNGPDINDIN